MTQRAGVVGFPIGHSLSPAIHGAWIKALGLDATYEAFEAPPDELEAFVERYRSELCGVNVTIPHKEAALALADDADEAAQAAGAANLLLFGPDGRVTARNTDGAGMMAAFRIVAPGFDPKGSRIEVRGAGGAARGAVAALAAAGNTDIVIVNRTPEKAQALAGAFSSVASACPESLTISKGVGVVINATSQGLGGTASPRLNWPSPNGPGVALDMVYASDPTEFLKDAAAKGWKTVNGLEMLIGQAAPSFEAFFGVPPPENYRVLALEACG